MADEENSAIDDIGSSPPKVTDLPPLNAKADESVPVEVESSDEISGVASEAAKPTRSRPKLIRIATAVKKLENLYGGSANAKKVIADKIEDGEIRAYAYRYWTSTSWKLSKAWGEGPPEDAAKQAKIKRSTWAASSLITKDMDVWVWEKGKLVISHVKRKRKILRHMYLDVRVSSSDIKKLVKAAEPKLKIPHAGGRKFNELEWSKVWMAAISIIQEAPTKQLTFTREKEFVGAVYQRYAAVKGQKGLEENTIRRALNQAYRSFIADGYLSEKIKESEKPVKV